MEAHFLPNPKEIPQWACFYLLTHAPTNTHRTIQVSDTFGTLDRVVYDRVTFLLHINTPPFP